MHKKCEKYVQICLEAPNGRTMLGYIGVGGSKIQKLKSMKDCGSEE
jgi:hypothetical protein